MAWVVLMASPSKTQAASTANSTSLRPSSEAKPGRNRATPAMPRV